MDLSDSQKNAVAQWVKDGQSLADVQRNLLEQYQLSMTYMDVRFLVDDLNVIFEEPEPEVEETEAGEPKVEEPEVVDAGGSAGVVVDVDAIMQPGTLVSGTVTFSDGESLKWQLSATGQLGLIPGDNPDYRPAPEDVQSFQTQLEEVLRSKGY